MFYWKVKKKKNEESKIKTFIYVKMSSECLPMSHNIPVFLAHDSYAAEQRLKVTNEIFD